MFIQNNKKQCFQNQHLQLGKRKGILNRDLHTDVVSSKVKPEVTIQNPLQQH